MLYLGSTVTNLTCSAIVSGRIANATQLKVFRDILGPVAHDPRKAEGVGRTRGKLGGEGGGGGAGAGGGDSGGQEGAGRGVGEDFCQDLKTRGGFHRWPVTEQEKQFPLAFSFKVHKAADMFERLLSVLWRPHNFYCVHVDLKASQTVFQRVANISRCLQNVVLSPRRLDVKYASILSLQADLECARLSLQAPVHWRYHLNLCGQEFPLKTNLEMVQLLSALNGTNDVENYPPSSFFAALSFKFKSFIVKGVNRQSNVSKPPFKHKDVEIRKGSAYNSLSRPFVEWALNFDEVSRDFLGWLNDTWAPDELFWATLSYRHGAPGGPGMDIRHSNDQVLTKAVNWKWDAYKCHGIFAPYKSSCILSSLDLPWLLKRHELIANKFESDMDSTVLDCLEQELERRAIAGYLETRSALAASGSTNNTSGSYGHGSRSSDLAGSSVNGTKFLGGWPLLSSLNWTVYRSLPQFSKSIP